MPRIHLFLFGTPRIEIDGKPITITRRKAMALLAFLVLADRVQSRATVSTLLWPDLDEDGARNALRSTLPTLTQLTEIEWLEIDRANVSIKNEVVWSDVQAFLQALVSVRLHAHEDTALCADCVSRLEEAANLYHDDFLVGFSLTDSVEFDRWQATKREWLHQEYTQTLRHLAEYYSASHLESAMNYARRWLEVDPMSEPAHRLLMRLYTLNGQRTEALRQYQECVRILDEELATLPEDETVRLYELIHNGGTPSNTLIENRDNRAAISVLPPLPGLIIGREVVLTELKQRIGIPDVGQKQPVTLIEGWPGVGKSTIIAALAHAPDVWAAYPDGVLWTSLGETPGLQAELMRWAEALHLVAQGKVLSLEELTSQIAAALRNRRMLLIIDDVWQVDHFTPFRVAGHQSATVISSRLSEVARALAPSATNVYRLPQLSSDSALLLLSRLAPQAVEQFPESAIELVRDLEGLPLAIQVAGRLLHEEMQMGWGIEHLIAELRSGARLLSEQTPSDVRTVAGDSSSTVAALLQRSTRALDQETLTRFALLGLFVPKPATFDLGAMAALWEVDDPRPTVRTLVNRGLLEPVTGGRFQMHALLVLHAKSLFANPAQG
ncbi:MAG: AAA family ATPase [Anaerolineae bacterium]|nr:AAA family ATPase [Anaerolineae bacterium]